MVIAQADFEGQLQALRAALEDERVQGRGLQRQASEARAEAGEAVEVANQRSRRLEAEKDWLARRGNELHGQLQASEALVAALGDEGHRLRSVRDGLEQEMDALKHNCEGRVALLEV